MAEDVDINILKNLTLLYIEDEDNIRDNISKTLKLLVQNVYACQNAEDALNKFKNNNIDIILSDIKLPKMSGLEFSKKIREIDTSIPIILLTAHVDTKYLLEATRLKLIDYLIKPIDFTSLTHVLQKAAKDLISEARYEVYFKNKTKYNMQKKCLFDENDIEIGLTSNEIELLEFMITNKQRVISTDEIKSLIWEDSFDATDSALKNILNKVRKKIGKESISNTSGIGYRLILN